MIELFELHTALIQCGVYTANEAGIALNLTYPPRLCTFADEDKKELFKSFLSEKTKQHARKLWLASRALKAIEQNKLEEVTNTILKFE